MKEWFKARNVWAGAFAALTDAEAGRLAKALWAYTTTGEQVELSGNEKGCFAMIVYTLQMDEEEANALSATRKEAGSKGGKQKVANVANATIKNKNKNIEKEEDVKENDLSVIKEKRQRFSPPTADEVKAYCQERGNHVDPQRFVDFYASKGWRVGNNPMKDWKAAVRTWEQRDNITPLNTGQTYTQRQYSEADLEARITEL